ncbi:MAG: amidase [Pseudomonadota bacterium]
MTPEEYREHDATGLAALVAKGEVAPSEPLEAAIALADRLDPALNALCLRLDDMARAEVAAGLPDAPLRGVPYLLKDVGARMKGTPTRYGARFWPDAPAEQDSVVVARLRAAGLAIFGKTTTPELGLAASTETTLTGDTRNPWDLTRSSGGSSGGATAAVAAGIVPAAHASDGGGSIRIPASHCALVGLKPTRARVTFAPDAGEGWGSLSSQHAVTRSVRDSAALLDAVAGPAPGDPYAAPHQPEPFSAALARPPRRLRVALQLAPLSGVEVDPECAGAAREAARLLEDLGHEVEEARPPGDWEELGHALWVLVSASVAATIRDVFAALGREPRREDMERVTWNAVEGARDFSAADYAAAISAIHRQSRRMAEFHARHDMLLTPTLAAPPPKLGLQHTDRTDPETYLATLTRMTAFTQLANLTGQPAISLPLHRTPDGLPVGVMLTGRFGDESGLLSLAAQVEAARPWAGRFPELP